MRKYAIIGSLLILGMALAGRAVSLAQKSTVAGGSLGSVYGETDLSVKFDESRSSGSPSAPLRNIPIVDEGTEPPTAPDNRPQLSSYQQVQHTLDTPQAGRAESKSDDRPPALELPPHRIHPTNLLLVSGVDPMGSIETFIARNKKEADQSIELLNQEAETLRDRLQKVEAALARWQAVSRALEARLPVPSAEITTIRTESTVDSTPAIKPSVGEPLETKPAAPVSSGPPLDLPPSLPPASGLPPTPLELPSAPANLPPGEAKPADPAPAALPPALPTPVGTKPEQPSADPFPSLPESKPATSPNEGVDLPAVPSPKIRDVSESAT